MRPVVLGSELDDDPRALHAALRLLGRSVPGEADHPVRDVAQHLAVVAAGLAVPEPLVAPADREIDVTGFAPGAAA